jgi:hypothetical protein
MIYLIDHGARLLWGGTSPESTRVAEEKEERSPQGAPPAWDTARKQITARWLKWESLGA